MEGNIDGIFGYPFEEGFTRPEIPKKEGSDLINPEHEEVLKYLLKHPDSYPNEISRALNDEVDGQGTKKMRGMLFYLKKRGLVDNPNGNILTKEGHSFVKKLEE